MSLVHPRASMRESARAELNTFYSRRESHRRATAHNYSYAIHQLAFMVKACVLTARYVENTRTGTRPWLEFTHTASTGECTGC